MINLQTLSIALDYNSILEYIIGVVLLIITIVSLILFIKKLKYTKLDLIKIILSIISWFFIVVGWSTDRSGLFGGSHSILVSEEVMYTVLPINVIMLILGLIIQPIIYKNNIEYLKNSNRQNKYLILFSIIINVIGMFLGDINNSLWLGVLVLLILLAINIIVLSIQNLIQALLIYKLTKKQEIKKEV